MLAHRGFTLIELIVALVILAIISSVVFIRSPSQQSFEVDAWAETLLRDIRYTQILSMSLNRSYRIIFASQRYTIQDENSQPHQHPASELNYIPLPSGMTLSSSQTTVVFDGAGVPRDTGGSELSSNTTITLTAGSESATVNIAPQTGFAYE